MTWNYIYIMATLTSCCAAILSPPWGSKGCPTIPILHLFETLFKKKERGVKPTWIKNCKFVKAFWHKIEMKLTWWFSGIFDMVSTEIRLILSIIVATDLNANFAKPFKKGPFEQCWKTAELVLWSIPKQSLIIGTRSNLHQPCARFSPSFSSFILKCSEIQICFHLWSGYRIADVVKSC